MNFAYCWEDKGCQGTCSVRERQVLFCWRARLEDHEMPRPCDSCDYRMKWVRGEYSVEAFVEKYNRRDRRRRERKVLVIDDDPHILYALEESVRNLGYEPVSAIDGEDGLVLARGILPDLIITDIVMPKVDGFALCTLLREDPKTRHIPVIIVTARDRKTDADRGRSLGTEAFLVKPFRARDLSDHITRVLAPPAASLSNYPVGTAGP
jgi:twitching motility two-component system response regulator PilH